MSYSIDMFGRVIALSGDSLLQWLAEPGTDRFVHWTSAMGRNLHAYLADRNSTYPRYPQVRASSAAALLRRGLIEVHHDTGFHPWCQISDAGRAHLAAALASQRSGSADDAQ